MPGPEVLAQRLRAAARAGDLDALHALVDWQLTGALAQAPALADVDPEDREAVAARGREEIELSAKDSDLVRSRLGQLLRDLGRGEVRAASDAVVVQLPDGADLHLQLAPDGERVVLS